jgi:hypothetical protein
MLFAIAWIVRSCGADPGAPVPGMEGIRCAVEKLDDPVPCLNGTAPLPARDGGAE